MRITKSSRTASIATLLVGSALVASSLGIARPARAADDDPWWGRDKALHFGVSGAIASGGYALGTAIFERRAPALLLGAGLAVGVGAAKEGADALGLGDPSWKDFTWDLAGTAVGLAVALGIDWLMTSIAAGEPKMRSF